MRYLKLPTHWLALDLSVVTLALHIGIGYLLAAVIKDTNLVVIWRRSLSIYWPALDLVQVLRLNVNVGEVAVIAQMIVAALLELWVIFGVGIWLIRLYFRKPPISKVSKAAIVVGVLVAAVCFYKINPQSLGDPRSPLEKAMAQGDVQAFEKILKSNPSLANKKMWANQTPLNEAIGYPHPKEFIDLLVKYGADINARGEPFETTLLQHAAWSGKTEAVKALLAHHPDVNALHKDKENTPTGYVWEDTDETALNYAFTADNKEIFSMLLAAGADINLGRSALTECMVYGGGRDSWAEFLLTNGADPNRLGSKADRFLPIIQAVSNGNTNYVAALLRHHVDLNVRYLNGADNFSPLELALDEGHWDVARLVADAMIQSHTNSISLAAANGDLESLRAVLATNPAAVKTYDETGFTALHWAAEAGQKDVAGLLLTNGADPMAKDWAGFHPLDWAAYMDRLSLVELLTANMTNGNQQGELLNRALVLTVQAGHFDVVQFLLQHGADANASVRIGKFYDSTPLETWASNHGDPQIADLLLANHADVKFKNKYGTTLLHLAVYDFPNQQINKQTVEWLLAHGADVNAKDNDGKTPLGFLSMRSRSHQFYRHQDIADLLRQHGGHE